MNKYYEIDEIRRGYRKDWLSNYPRLEELVFKLNLFRRMNRIYFKRTPESDSLYRRRNRLIILSWSCFFYYKTNKNIFERVEFEILTQSGILNKIVNIFNIEATCL